jgi:hypothetical protein
LWTLLVDLLDEAALDAFLSGAVRGELVVVVRREVIEEVEQAAERVGTREQVLALVGLVQPLLVTGLRTLLTAEGIDVLDGESCRSM